MRHSLTFFFICNISNHLVLLDFFLLKVWNQMIRHLTFVVSDWRWPIAKQKVHITSYRKHPAVSSFNLFVAFLLDERFHRFVRTVKVVWWYLELLQLALFSACRIYWLVYSMMTGGFNETNLYGWFVMIRKENIQAFRPCSSAWLAKQ